MPKLKKETGYIKYRLNPISIYGIIAYRHL